MAQPVTKTDPGGPNAWKIFDEVIQLREWGTSMVHPLPPRGGPALIGTGEGCWVRLFDPAGRMSRKHAELTYKAGIGWIVADLQSKNGVRVDGVRVPSTNLNPGNHIRCGGMTLVAESRKLCALRDLLGRLLGWDDDEQIEIALSSVRNAASLNEPLVLCGAGKLVTVARSLHRRITDDGPFVFFGPRSRHATGMQALEAAAGGTLCIWRHQQPSDFGEVVRSLLEGRARSLLVICSPTLPRGNDVAAQVATAFRAIFLTPLADREKDLHRIIDGYAGDAIAMLGGWFTPADRDWVVQHEAQTVSHIEIATRRIVALHACEESVTGAAKQLSMCHSSLSVWTARRGLPGNPRQDGPAPALEEGPFEDDE